MDKTKIKKIIKNQQKILYKEAGRNLISIYDFDIYNNIFIDDLNIFQNLVPSNSNVLDFGCGRGTTSFVLSNLGYKVKGIDVLTKVVEDEYSSSYVFLEGLQKKVWDRTKKVAKGKIDFLFYDGRKLPFPDKHFDAIFACAVLEHVDDLKYTVKELSRVLKPHGILFVSRTPNKYSVMEWIADVFHIPAHDNRYSKKVITHQINRCFKIRSIELVDFFPSNLLNRRVTNVYEKFAPMLFYLELLLRRTPLKFFAHHWRIACIKK